MCLLSHVILSILTLCTKIQSNVVSHAFLRSSMQGQYTNCIRLIVVLLFGLNAAAITRSLLSK